MRYPSGVALSEQHCDRVARYARGALVAGDALDRLPTPLDDVADALHLAPAVDLFELGDAPPRIRALARRLKGKLLGALSVRERVVYIDRSQNVQRQRFTHAHELGHDALPWHRDAYFGDDSYTLRPDTRALLESEANRFSADLLFQLDRFTEEAAGFRTGLAVPLDLAGTFDTSVHASIRRYAETNPRLCALLTFGKYPVYPDGRRSLKLLYALESTSFRDRYGAAVNLLPGALPVDGSSLAHDAYDALRGVTPEPVISGVTRLETRRGGVNFRYEVYSNTYSVFALLYPRRPTLGRTVSASWTASDGAA